MEGNLFNYSEYKFVCDSLEESRKYLKLAEQDKRNLSDEIYRLNSKNKELCELLFLQEKCGIIYERGVFNTLTWYEGSALNIGSVKRCLIRIFWHFYLFQSNHPFKAELKSSNMIFSPEITGLFNRLFVGVCKPEQNSEKLTK
jgi:hypothetical protein